MRLILPCGSVEGVIRATSTTPASVGAPTSRPVIHVSRRSFSTILEEDVTVGHATRQYGCHIGSDSLLGGAAPEEGSPGAVGDSVVLAAGHRSAQGR